MGYKLPSLNQCLVSTGAIYAQHFKWTHSLLKIFNRIKQQNEISDFTWLKITDPKQQPINILTSLSQFWVHKRLSRHNTVNRRMISTKLAQFISGSFWRRIFLDASYQEWTHLQQHRYHCWSQNKHTVHLHILWPLASTRLPHKKLCAFLANTPCNWSFTYFRNQLHVSS